jgi:aryl-alcohol dehydrogenase-like predicted oxidoreductase
MSVERARPRMERGPTVVTPAADTNVHTRPFGRTDLRVSEFGLGCARIGGIFKREPAEFVNLVDAAFDAGITFFDTADIYSQGESEKILGRAFRRRRDRVVIASKAGYVLPSQRRIVARLKPFVRPLVRLLGISRRHLPGTVSGSLDQDFSPAHLTRAVEGSLRRLSTDRLDLFQLHSPPVNVIEPGEWVDALETLKQQGKIRYYGISCDSVDAALAALRNDGVSSLQLSISLLERDALRVLPSASSQGVGVIARECLANGLLVKDVPAADVRSYCRSDDEAAAKVSQIERYRKDADEQGCSMAQLALQFVRGLAGVSVTLIGVSSLTQLDALLSKGLPSLPPRVPR